LFAKVNLMFQLFGAELWSYDPDVEPPCLANMNQFGGWVFVIRNSSRQFDRAWFKINHQTIAIDAGIKAFETIYNVGTGDIYIVGYGLGIKVRNIQSRISNLQSKLDKQINRDINVIILKRVWQAAKARLFDEV
jgi:hypothetical protein